MKEVVTAVLCCGVAAVCHHTDRWQVPNIKDTVSGYDTFSYRYA